VCVHVRVCVYVRERETDRDVTHRFLSGVSYIAPEW